jgi:hypothetical protein
MCFAQAEKLAQRAADTAAKAAAAAEVAADAAGASKIKRQEAEKRARELWNQVTAADKSASRQFSGRSRTSRVCFVWLSPVSSVGCTGDDGGDGAEDGGGEADGEPLQMSKRLSVYP